ncbi:MAG TPA: YdeI/OmpD-associated family protein [Kofleriaceae bacterium]|nr:YdeI/OmpD-associated family protein [Kofleriaceae bacterium]
MDPKPGEPVLPFETAAAFERWLAKQHRSATVVWIKHAKKGTGMASITWSEAVDVALCYGWIDGQSKSLDDRHFVQRYTPRRASSVWSKLNRERVARLIAAGRMQSAGLAEIERAKADGRWDAAYDSPKTAAVPDDLARAFAKRPAAKAAFATLDSTNRYAILHRLMTAKQPETRARRLATFVEMLEAGKTLHPRRSGAKAAATSPPPRSSTRRRRR